MVWLAKIAGSNIGLFVIAFAVGALVPLWFQGRAYDRGVTNEKARQLTAMTKVWGQMRKRHEEELKSRGWQDNVEADYAREINVQLQNRLSEIAAIPPETLIVTKVVRDESGCSCPTVSLGDEFWMRYRSSGEGRAADPAAPDPVPGQM